MPTDDETLCIVDVEVALGVYGFPAAVMEPSAELAPVILQKPEEPVVVIAAQEN